MAVTLWSAWAFGLAALCTPAGSLWAQEKAVDKCVFEGTARNSATRLALGKATIRLIPQDGSVGYSGSSNAIGFFHFEGIAAGDYEVEAHRPGYSDPPVLSDSAGHASSTIHLTPGQKLAGNELWFTPESSLTGKVFGPDGEPLPGALVTLILRKWRRGKRVYVGAYGTAADDAGLYRFPAIDPGQYFIYAARPHQGPLAFSIREAPGKPELRIAGRYHPDSAQLDGATPVEVKGGEEISGIDFKLPLAPVFHLTGKGEPPTASETAGISLKPRYHDQVLDWGAEGTAISPDGTFDLAGVMPGSYFLSAFQSMQQDRLVSAKIPVTVTDRDVADVAPPTVRRFELKGRVRLEGGATADSLPVQIFSEGSEADEYSSLMRRAQPKADGTFSIDDLTPDRYTIRVANMETGKDGGTYLKSVRVNGVVAPNDEIDLSGGPAEGVELILSGAVGNVEGTVRWPDEAANRNGAPEPAGELTVVVVPEKLASNDSRTQTVFLDQDRHFQVSDLEPGTYRLFAVTKYDQGLWQNADFLRQIASRGTAVEVSEKGTAHVEAQLLRAADVRTVEERVQ